MCNRHKAVLERREPMIHIFEIQEVPRQEVEGYKDGGP